MLAAADASPESAAARSLWRGITYAVVAWYVIDSIISVRTGFALNALSNTLFLAAYLFVAGRTGALHAA